MSNPRPLRTAGALLVGGALGFSAVFSVLAALMDYPDVLDRPAGEVLPVLLSGGLTLRAVWLIYAALPLAVAGAAWLARRSLPPVITAAGLATGASMLVGLVRWPTLMWSLASSFTGADAAQQAHLAATFDTANFILGNLIGELLGELFLSLFVAGVGLAGARGGFLPRWLGTASVMAAVSFVVGALRNLTSLVAPVAEVNNYLIPLALIALGVGLVRAPQSPARAGTVAAR